MKWQPKGRIKRGRAELTQLNGIQNMTQKGLAEEDRENEDPLKCIQTQENGNIAQPAKYIIIIIIIIIIITDMGNLDVFYQLMAIRLLKIILPTLQLKSMNIFISDNLKRIQIVFPIKIIPPFSRKSIKYITLKYTIGLTFAVCHKLRLIFTKLT